MSAANGSFFQSLGLHVHVRSLFKCAVLARDHRKPQISNCHNHLVKNIALSNNRLITVFYISETGETNPLGVYAIHRFLPEKAFKNVCQVYDVKCVGRCCKA